MSAPEVIDITALLRCECGEEYEFDGIEDGWHHVQPCDCGRYLSISVGDPIAQYESGPTFTQEAVTA